MKNRAKFYALIALLFIAQACGLKDEERNEKAAVKAKPVQTGGLATMEQQRAKHKKDSTMIASKRMKEWNEMVMNTPTYTDRKGVVIYHTAEVSPTFVGGQKAMMKYLNSNVVYPKQAEKDQLEGTVFVDFVVDSEGIVSDVVVTDATDVNVAQAFRNEAVRLVSSMPKWNPGTQSNKAVNVKYSIPVTFQIR